MGSLTPGATYVYERANGVTYAREFGANPSTRQAVGWNYDESAVANSYKNQMVEDILWADIRRAAKTNPAIDDLLTQAKMLYNLSKDNE